ncbi:hypothetical protein HYX58_04365 [Candidatus Dependentiae bacterium]|nr:hypothetical protein [Candidatus Dependentiae bacterium]
MVRLRKNLLLFTVICCWGISLRAMVFDNRYFPLFPHTFSRTPAKRTYASADAFFMLAHNATDEEDITFGIPEIWGRYDLIKLANAFVLLGNANPLAPDFDQFSSIIYNMSGAIDSQGIEWAYEHRFTKHFSIGFNAFFMHLFSRINFRLDDQLIRQYGLSEDQILQLDQIRRQLQNSLGFEPTKSSTVGFSDIDLYFRFGKIWEYFLKFKRIDLGIRGGMMINTGKKRDVNNPASLPYGGNGFFGLYLAGDAEFELKEDWKAGLYVRMSKRFARTFPNRIPIANEQPLFGAVLGDLRVDPGLTFAISPYARVEDIRDGLGGQLQYTAVVHYDDLYVDKRENPIPSATLQALNDRSDFGSEYFTVNLFYDFSRVRKPHWCAPIVQLQWDMPVSVLAAKRVSKTQRFSLGLLLSF